MVLTLVSKLKAIRDARMRAGVLADHVAGQSAEAAVLELSQIIASSVRRGDTGAELALASLAHALSLDGLVPYDKRRDIYVLAKRLGHEEVARLFLQAAPAQAGGASSGDPMAPERPLTPNGRPLTLGERKAMARGHRREMLLHLLRDPHPDVVAVLLDNPHLTEPDVVALAARRPSTPDALAHVAASQRWVPRYNVRLALVKNPYTPLPWAVRLATTLRMLDLRQVAADPNLAPLLREQAADLCQRSASPR
jgi:hypothetical protein